jgi:hypothetical protein
VACSLPNANESCATGACQVTTCASGFANCDSNQANGCELPLSGSTNTAPGEFLGSFAADSASGFLCSGDGCSFVVSRSGTRGRFFQVEAREESNCAAYVGLRFELQVPAGVDYDLFVSGSCLCDRAGCRSEAGTGQTEQLVAWCNDDGGSDDTFTANVEVRYFSGASCVPWTLNVYAGGC